MGEYGLAAEVKDWVGEEGVVLEEIQRELEDQQGEQDEKDIIKNR